MLLNTNMHTPRKRPPDPTLEAIYRALKDRKLVKHTTDFMVQYLPTLARSMYHQKASAITLLRLWTSLNEHAQHDLAIVAHKALLASASHQPSQGVQ